MGGQGEGIVPALTDCLKVALFLGFLLGIPVAIGVSIAFSEIRSQEVQETRKNAVRELYPNLTDSQFDYFYHRGLLAAPKPVEAKP